MEGMIDGAETFLPYHGFSTPDLAAHHAILDSQYPQWASPHASWHHPFQSSLGEAANYAMASLLHPHLKSSPRHEGANLTRSTYGNGWKTSEESLTILRALGDPLQNGIYSTDTASQSAAMEASKGWLESKHRLQSSKMVKQNLKPADGKWVSVGDASIGLKLGKRTYYEASVEAGKATFSSGRKQKACGAPGMSCQVDGCKADLSDSKNYHRRHKVCEVHSKAPIVLCNGKEHRFCQQCSRFHELMEFDDTKRSCRKKLADHNERRRKPVHNVTTATNQDLQAANSEMPHHHHQEGLKLPSNSRESSLLFGSSPGLAPDCGRALSLLSPRSLLSTVSASKSIEETQQFINSHISRTTITASVTLPELVTASTAAEEKIFRLSLTAMDEEQQHEEVPLMSTGMLAQFLLNSEQVRTLDLMQLPASHQQYNRGTQHG